MEEIKNGSITITGLSEFEEAVARLRTDNPGFEKRLRGAIRKIMGEARKSLSGSAAAGLQMQSDPRHAYKAVRYAVYKKLFGGQVNILQSRKAGSETTFKMPRTLRPKQRGGNRRKRVSRSLEIYEGKDRGFILRWLNQGTVERAVPFKENSRRKTDRWNHHPNSGNRGSIAARNWFGNASLQELQDAAGKMQDIIDSVIKEEFV